MALDAYAQQVDHRNIETELAGRKMAPATPERLAALGQLLATMMSSLRATPEHADPQMRKAMEQALFATLLDTLSSGSVQATAPSCSARQLVVARARAYMEAHIDEPITVADLCIELGVSRRTLQYSFQDVLDLNPVKFLRAIRLNAVRRALKAAPTAAAPSPTSPRAGASGTCRTFPPNTRRCSASYRRTRSGVRAERAHHPLK